MFEKGTKIQIIEKSVKYREDEEQDKGFKFMEEDPLRKKMRENMEAIKKKAKERALSKDQAREVRLILNIISPDNFEKKY